MSGGGVTDSCEVFVKGVPDKAALVHLVESAVTGSSNRSLITSDSGIEIDVTTNSHNPKFEAVPPAESDFVFWPYIVGLEVDEEQGVELVTSILRKLWGEGLSAVAACSFEHRLPRSGGYKDGRLILADE